MSAPVRPSLPTKRTQMRPPSMRPPPSRAQTATPSLSGRTSPTNSVMSTKSPKRRERDLEHEAGEETNINVVVRCRGRNDREVRENSGVVVSTDGVRGKKVELSMGPSALSNKTYQFDKVFSPAADQGMIFDEVVSPILDEVLAGFNCTVFAYGQTGTGKTYTMTGDITDMLPLPDAAGIVPRVLCALFDKLGERDESENSVKCSFIELYNEELRDLVSTDDSAKLKIFDDNSKKGQTTTIVQGMEECYIKTASKGLELLRNGTNKRQVAATKCNDLSSRSHTVFTITVNLKRTTESGEEYMSAGKLNLVDLAGSENIQRSGAENKRAAEAGLINKSLLTLGRVINALVERGSHIPYRESKLTRLLQDSLGGRTKTCIIATLSPAKSNLEETISTLDYAFRAKNIRNKPQVNQMVSKSTHVKELTVEIEKLRSELIATRHRNGVYLTAENFEEITTESESRRILADEQKDKIETMEANLRNKVNDLFTMTSNFNNLKKDNEAVRAMMDETKNLLEKTEIILAHTKRNLAEETYIRQAHQRTEKQLAGIGGDLLSTLETTTGDISGLHSKLRRRSDLHSVVRNQWGSTQTRVADATEVVDQRMEALKQQQEELLALLSQRMQGFVKDELKELQQSQSFLQEKAASFQQSEQEVNAQTLKSRDEVNVVLEEIKTLREDVKREVGAGLNDLSAAAQRISAGIAAKLETFHTQLHSSYASLGRDFKNIFDDVTRQMSEQQSEADQLRQQISAANTSFVGAGQDTRKILEQAMEEERQRAAAEREQLLTQISSLLTSSAEAQEKRVAEHIAHAAKRVKTSEDEYSVAQQSYHDGMGAWNSKSQAIIESCVRSRETVKQKIKSDWNVANTQTETIKHTTDAVHAETIQIVNAQMAHMDTQLQALDEIVARVRAQNEEHHKSHTSSLAELSSNVQQSYNSIGARMDTSYKRTHSLQSDMLERTNALLETLPSMGADSEIRQDLLALRDEITASAIAEYVPTGQTPAKTQYTYPTALPRTEAHERLLERMRSGSDPEPFRSPTKITTSPRRAQSSPSKGVIYNDSPTAVSVSAEPAPLSLYRPDSAPASRSGLPTPPLGLREIDVNITANTGLDAATETGSKIGAPSLKRPGTAGLEGKGDSKLPMKRTRMTVAGVAEGRENLLHQSFGASVGPGGRRLRPRGSD